MRALMLVAGVSLAACGPPSPSASPAYTRVGDAIPEPLTQTAGDPVRGATLFSERDGGHCVLCHQVEGLDTPFQGNVGPALTEVGTRLDAAQLRLRIADYQQVRPGAVMPSYYRTDGLNQVETPYQGETILSAQDVEDIVAYLAGQDQTDERN